MREFVFVRTFSTYRKTDPLTQICQSVHKSIRKTQMYDKVRITHSE